MIVLDAYALIALLRGERAADRVESALRGSEPVGIVSVNLAEVIDKLLRVAKLTLSDIQDLLGPLLAEKISIVPVDGRAAWQAGWIRGRYYARRDCALSMADSCLIGSVGEQDRILTADRPVLEVARRLNLEAIEI